MAGVSVGTVDRVLHQRGRVSEDANAKVQEVLKKIDYKPNLIARSLGRASQLRIIALIPNPEFDGYWREVQLGIQQARDEWTHYGVTVSTFLYEQGGEEAMEKVAIEALKTNPDGFVIGPIFQRLAVPVLERLRDKKIPFVLFNANLPELNPLCFIGQDLFQSGMLAARLMSSEIEGVEGTLAILHVGEDIGESIYLMDKERGFREYFKGAKNNSKINVQSFNFNVPTHSIGGQIEILLSTPNLQGIYVTTSKALGPIASVLAKHPRRSEITLIGYDMLDENLRYLKKDVITYLINQNPKRQPMVGISHLANHLLFKTQIPTIDLFPLEIIAKQNLDSYLASSIH